MRAGQKLRPRHLQAHELGGEVTERFEDTFAGVAALRGFSHPLSPVARQQLELCSDWCQFFDPQPFGETSEQVQIERISDEIHQRVICLAEDGRQSRR